MILRVGADDVVKPLVGRTAHGWAVVAVGMLGLVLSACGSGPSPVEPVAESPLQAAEVPVIDSFTADPDRIEEGGVSELSWRVSDPSAELTIAPLGQVVSGTSITVSPIVTTTYTLTATNMAGSSRATAVVRVSPNDEALNDESGSQVDVEAVGDWTPVTNNLVGQATECGNVTYVTSHPQLDMIIAGVALNGLWALSGDSEEWVKLGGDGGPPIVNRPTTIVFDPEDPLRWWESGIYSGPGVFETGDNGASFAALGDVTNSDLVSVDLDDPGRRTLLSGTHERTQVMRSQDGGASWQDITGGLPADIGFAASVHVIDESTYLVGTKPSFGEALNGGVGVYRTEDGGLTWNRVFDAGVIGRPLEESDGTLHWLLAGGLGMITSSDAGATWSFAGDGPSADPAMSLIALPGDRLATTADNFVITSSDGGLEWQRVGPRLPFDVAGIVYSPSRNAFFAWQSDCTDEIRSDSIVRLDLAPLPVR